MLKESVPLLAGVVEAGVDDGVVDGVDSEESCLSTTSPRTLVSSRAKTHGRITIMLAGLESKRPIAEAAAARFGRARAQSLVLSNAERGKQKQSGQGAGAPCNNT